MYISKVEVKESRELFNVFKQETGSYAAHQLLWNLFPNNGNKKRDFIFHRDDQNGCPQFLVVSKTKPVEFSGLSVCTKQYSPKLLKGQRLAFTLVANPVITIKTEGKKNSIKHSIWMYTKKQMEMSIKHNAGVYKKTSLNVAKVQQACEKAAKKWLIRQGVAHGFSMEENGIIINRCTQNCIGRKKAPPIYYSAIHYNGFLTISDPEIFLDLLGKGIGKSKAFGCGLLLVKRI